MSELPITPVLDEKSEQIKKNVEQRYHTGQVDRDFAAWEHGFATESQLNLEVEDTPNPNLWTDDTAPVTPTPEYVAPTLTHEQKTERDLMFYDDKQLVAYALANTRAVVSMRRLT